MEGGDNIPKWEIHNKWAVEMGASKELSNEINEIIDFDGIHDGRQDPQTFLKDVEKSYETGGFTGMKVFFLHHILDRLEELLRGEAYRGVWGKPQRGESYVLNVAISETRDWFENYLKNLDHLDEAGKALEEVIEFVERHSGEIIKEIKKLL